MASGSIIELNGSVNLHILNPGHLRHMFTNMSYESWRRFRMGVNFNSHYKREYVHVYIQVLTTSSRISTNPHHEPNLVQIFKVSKRLNWSDVVKWQMECVHSLNIPLEWPIMVRIALNNSHKQSFHAATTILCTFQLIFVLRTVSNTSRSRPILPSAQICNFF